MQHRTVFRNIERTRLAVLALMVGAVAAAHYSIDRNAALYHDMLRRSMYVPIILAAVWFGTTGGVGVAFTAAVLYAPHLFFQQQWARPEEIDRAAEMLLYVVVGGLTGLLAEREKRQRRQAERALARLEHAHDELRRQAERLAEVQEGLRQVERLSTLGELAADLAHEIRNPLAALRGTVQILTSEFPPRHQKHEFASLAIEELDRLNRVLEGYLHTAHSRIVRGGRSDAVATVTTVLELTRRQAQRNGVSVERHGATRLILPMDAGQLTQVVMNLVLNAIQAMPDGGTLRIACQALPAPEHGQRLGEVTVGDTGLGVTAENREKIFQPFFTTKPSGTGLGLSIARRLVTEHGGSLTLDATRADGSTFRIRLPVVDQ